MKTKTIWIAAALCVWSVGALAQAAPSAKGQSVYSWVDAKGARHYSDRPPVGSQLAPIKVKVSKPADQASGQAVASLDARPAVPSDVQKAAEEKQKRERAEDCEVARNNLRLLDDPKSQIVEKGVEGAQAMDNMARIEARVLAERQVQDFCR